MSVSETGNRLIAKNATILYIRMFFIVAINFYTSRIVLQALGAVDYGIFYLVGGIISLLSVLINSLSSATSRFITHALGKDDPDNLKLTFSTAFWIHGGLTFVFIILAETIGLWFVNTQLVIASDRMVAANWVYQAAIVTTSMGITQTPYSSSIVSHERFKVFAYIEILGALIRLGIAGIILIYSGDHLILYSILYMILSVSIMLYNRFYSIIHFEECHITRCFDKLLFKEMLFFSGWSIFGSISLTLKQQGFNIIINRFFGTLLNAAGGVASQIQGILYAFSGNICTAFNPQIIKSYAASDYRRVNNLIVEGTKFTVFVTLFTCIPFVFNMDFLMRIWLNEVPKGAVVICQILLVSNIFNSFQPFVGTTLSATGRIKEANIVMSVVYIISLIVSYFVLKITNSYILAYAFSLITSPIASVVYVFLLRKIMPSFSARDYVFKSCMPMFMILIADLLLAYVLYMSIDTPLIAVTLIVIVCESFLCLTTYYFAFDKSSRILVKDLVMSKLKK